MKADFYTDLNLSLRETLHGSPYLVIVSGLTISSINAEFLNLGCYHPQGVLKSISGDAGEGHICGGQR